MVCFRFFVILVVVAAMMPSSYTAPMPLPSPSLLDALFPAAMARARANDRGAGSFAGFGTGRFGGGGFINPDPFAFPGQAPFPASPIFF